MDFCQFLKTKRKEKNMSLQSLAEKLHYTKQYIYYMEQGQNKPFQSYEKLKQLADALELNKEDEYKLYSLACGNDGVPADIIHILIKNKKLHQEIREKFAGEEV